MGNFDSIFDQMTAGYEQIEGMMSSLYDELQSNPSRQELQDIIKELGDIALSQLSTQMNYTELYADPSIKETLIVRLSAKEASLKEALASTVGKSK